MNLKNSFIVVLSLLAAVASLSCTVPAARKGEGMTGMEIYYGKCSFCHRPFPPESLSAGEWPDILDEMAPRAGLSAAEKRKVLKFLRRLPEK